MRVLDIDLDFFVIPAIHWPPNWDRPPSDEHEVWEPDAAMTFLAERCGLVGKLPGFATETHDQLFWRWRSAIESGALTTPFHVTHVDVHADLGLGDAGWVYLMTELLFDPPGARTNPRTGAQGLNEVNFMLFALACRWLSELRYVYCEGGGGDELAYVLKDMRRPAETLQLLGMDEHNKERLLHRNAPEILVREPEVPYAAGRWEDFTADAPYDLVCLTHSPRYTPEAADSLLESIRSTFIDEVQ